jgi:hypothetical protein
MAARAVDPDGLDRLLFFFYCLRQQKERSSWKVRLSVQGDTGRRKGRRKGSLRFINQCDPISYSGENASPVMFSTMAAHPAAFAIVIAHNSGMLLLLVWIKKRGRIDLFDFRLNR